MKFLKNKKFWATVGAFGVEFVSKLPMVGLGFVSGWAVGSVTAHVMPLAVAIILGAMFDLVWLGALFLTPEPEPDDGDSNKLYQAVVWSALVCAIVYNCIYFADFYKLINYKDAVIAWVIVLIHGVPIPALNFLYSVLVENAIKAKIRKRRAAAEQVSEAVKLAAELDTARLELAELKSATTTAPITPESLWQMLQQQGNWLYSALLAELRNSFRDGVTVELERTIERVTAAISVPQAVEVLPQHSAPALPTAELDRTVLLDNVYAVVFDIANDYRNKGSKYGVTNKSEFGRVLREKLEQAVENAI